MWPRIPSVLLVVAVLPPDCLAPEVAQDESHTGARQHAEEEHQRSRFLISWAIVRDLYEGAEAARAFSRLQIVSGIAPVAAPLAGGALLTVMDWRGIFLVLAGVGVVLFVVAGIVTAVLLRRFSSFSPEVAS